MFADLDATLKAMLTDPAAPAEIRNADLSFDTPDRDFKPTGPAVDLFLHDVSENRGLRDDARIIDRVDGSYTSRPPPLRMDCTYLATAWSAKSAGLKTQEEHVLLGQALTWLSRFPVIEDRFLQGGLLAPPQPYALPMAVAQAPEGQRLGEFWSALGIAPRPAFSLTVTISVQPIDQVDHYPAVDHVRIHTASIDQPALAGRVLAHTMAPLPDAQVAVVGTGLQMAVDPTGAFSFSGLDFGPHTLQVFVPNQPAVQALVHYAARAQIHNLIVPDGDHG